LRGALWLGWVGEWQFTCGDKNKQGLLLACQCNTRRPWRAALPTVKLQGVIGDIAAGYTLVPLDKVDLSLVSVLYTQVGPWVGVGWGEAG